MTTNKQSLVFSHIQRSHFLIKYLIALLRTFDRRISPKSDMNRFTHSIEESLPPFERESILDTKEETESETKKNIVLKMAIGGFREKAKGFL